MKRKKHNKMKSLVATCRRALNGLAISYVTRGKSEKNFAQLIDLSGNAQSMTRDLCTAVTDIRYKWSIYLSVFGLDAEGNKYTKSKLVNCTHEYLQCDLVDLLNDEHQKMMGEFNPAHICGAGWIASPLGVDLTEEKAFNIFNKLNAWRESK